MVTCGKWQQDNNQEALLCEQLAHCDVETKASQIQCQGPCMFPPTHSVAKLMALNKQQAALPLLHSHPWLGPLQRAAVMAGDANLLAPFITMDTWATELP